MKDRIVCSNCGQLFHGLTPCLSRRSPKPEVNEIDPLHTLRDLEAWMRSAITEGQRETKGHADNNGHPHFWTALLIPDWQMNQKLANVSDCLALLAASPAQQETR